MESATRGVSRRSLLKAGLQAAGSVALSACRLPEAINIA